MIITIDGPAGSGKSTIARRLSQKFGVPYLDTGAMYRALTWLAVEKSVPLEDSAALERLAGRAKLRFDAFLGRRPRTMINGTDVTRKIRTPELTNRVHFVATVPGVRAQMVKLQRRMARRGGGVIEGRDIGTVVFPRAPHKFYLDADFKVRVRRRFEELKARGLSTSLAELARDQKERDRRDFTRKVGPLKKADDAVLIDSTALTIRQTVDRIAKFIRAKGVLSGR